MLSEVLLCTHWSRNAIAREAATTVALELIQEMLMRAFAADTANAWLRLLVPLLLLDAMTVIVLHRIDKAKGTILALLAGGAAMMGLYNAKEE